MAKASKKAAKKTAKPPVKKIPPAKKPVTQKEKAKEKTPEVFNEEVVEEIIQPEPEEKKNDCPEEEPVGGTEFSEFTIKEIMVQKSVDRATAIEILRNPTK